VYAAQREIGLRKTGKTLRGVPCRSKQLAGHDFNRRERMV
jgi:hypothetical protein